MVGSSSFGRVRHDLKNEAVNALKDFSLKCEIEKNGWRERQPLVRSVSPEARSAMSASARAAAVEAATTMGSAVTVKLTPAVESTAMEITIAAESSAMEVMPTMKIALAMEIAERVTIPEPVMITESVVVAAEITIAGPVIAAVETVEPRTRADKNAAIEVFGSVIAVGRASVWVISVVAVEAVGRRTYVSRRRNIARTNSNAYAKSHLGIGGRARENYQQPD